MNLLTPAGHLAFGIVWALGVLAIVLGFSGVGGLRFAPWLLLLIAFAAVRLGFRRNESTRSTVAVNSLRAANVLVEVAMISIFVYLYNLAILSYCAPPK
jgi:hypothetical protein